MVLHIAYMVYVWHFGMKTIFRVFVAIRMAYFDYKVVFSVSITLFFFISSYPSFSTFC